MKFRFPSHALLSFLLLLLASFPSSAQQIRVCCYNMRDNPTSAAQDQNMRVIMQAVGDLEIFGETAAIDLLAFQEGPESVAEYADIEANLEFVFGSDYDSTFTAPDFAGCRTGFVYDRNRLQLLNAITLSGGLTHNIRRGQFRLIGGTVEDEFFIYSIHLKAGTNSSQDAALREIEAQIIRNNAATLPSDANIIYCGDFNIAGSDEAAYIKFFEAGNNATAFETLNSPFGFRPNVNWQEEIAFLPFHTQNPVNNMDDRFDAFYVNDELLNRSGMEYVRGSCTVLGNNGTHNLNQSINTGTGTGGFSTQLVNFSDHLPVICTFEFAKPSQEFNFDLQSDAVLTRTIRPTGPVAGSSGDNFLTIEGSGFGNFASFGVVDVDLSTIKIDGVIEDLDEIVLEIKQSNAGFTTNGPVGLYLAAESAAAVPIDSSINYQTGQNGLGCVPAILSAGAEKVATYAAVHRIDTLLPNGTVDPIALFGTAVRDRLIAAIKNQTGLRFFIVPDASGTAATYAGFASSFGAPTLTADLVVNDGSRDVSAQSVSIVNGTPGGGDVGDTEASDDDRIEFFSFVGPSESVPPIQVTFSGNIGNSSPTALEVVIESSVNSPNIQLSVELFNFSSSQWETIGTNSAELQDTLVELQASGDLSRFVLSGLILTRVSWAPNGPVLQFPWAANVDLFEWSVID